MDFTFGLLLYNQEEYAIETLESIKFQIIHYGNDVNFNLIITDDASKDNSVKIVKKWLDVNNKLFKNILFNVNKVNKGTVWGQQFILDNNKTKYCKIIACDDVFGSHNLFEEFQNLRSKQIKSFICTELKGHSLKFHEDRLREFYINKKEVCKKHDHLKKMRRGCYIHTPSTIYISTMYELGECKKNNQQFRLFEDDPSWYAMLKNIDNLNVEFEEDIIVLYRISTQSISNNLDTNNIFYSELKQLWGIYYKETYGMEKIYFWFRLHDKLPKILRYDKYVDKLRRWKIKHLLRKDPNYKIFLEHIRKKIEQEQKFYNEILANTKEFLELIKNNP